MGTRVTETFQNTDGKCAAFLTRIAICKYYIYLLQKQDFDSIY